MCDKSDDRNESTTATNTKSPYVHMPESRRYQGIKEEFVRNLILRRFGRRLADKKRPLHRSGG